MAKTKGKQSQEKAPNAFIALAESSCLMGKFSNNLVLQENEDDPDDEGDEVAVWTFPFTGIMLTDELLNALYQDAYTHRAWYVTKKGVDAPMPWVGMLPPPIPFGQKFENASIDLAYADSPTDKTARDTFNGCKIGRILLVPQQGGLTELRCHIQIKPGLGAANKRLQEYQNRRVSLTVVSADVAAAKDSKQQQLALGAPPSGEAKPVDEAEAFAEKAKGQVEGWKNRRRKPGESADSEDSDGAVSH